MASTDDPGSSGRFYAIQIRVRKLYDRRRLRPQDSPTFKVNY
jgi:hypothetical protein